MKSDPLPFVSPLKSSLSQSMELTLYVVETAPYQSLDIRGMVRPHWIISFVSAGKVITHTNGIRTEVRAGDAMIHPAGVPFDELSDEPGIHLWIAFDLKVPPNTDLLRIHSVAPVVKITDADEYRKTFTRLQRVCAEPGGALREARAFSLAVELISKVLDSWIIAGSPERPVEMGIPRDRFFDVIRYMEAHLADRLQREDLAKLAYLHPGYFDRVFRTAYGVSPTQMLRELRLQRACKLLDATNRGLDAIAEACGLGDAITLSKAFRRRYGVSPGRYREGSKKARESYISP